MKKMLTIFKPHWSPDANYSSCPFFIRRMDTLGYFKPAEAPVAHLPLVGSFQESVFDPGRMPGTIATYAEKDARIILILSHIGLNYPAAFS